MFTLIKFCARPVLMRSTRRLRPPPLTIGRGPVASVATIARASGGGGRPGHRCLGFSPTEHAPRPETTACFHGYNCARHIIWGTVCDVPRAGGGAIQAAPPFGPFRFISTLRKRRKKPVARFPY